MALILIKKIDWALIAIYFYLCRHALNDEYN
jgi:hypothetical protein